MQAPHPPQNKIAQKNKVWAKKAFKKIGQSMDFSVGQSEIFGQPV